MITTLKELSNNKTFTIHENIWEYSKPSNVSAELLPNGEALLLENTGCNLSTRLVEIPKA